MTKKENIIVKIIINRKDKEEAILLYGVAILTIMCLLDTLLGIKCFLVSLVIVMGTIFIFFVIMEIIAKREEKR